MQNTRKGERLKFESLDVFAGEWLRGVGTHTDADGKARRAAGCIGPEHGTVGALLIKEAAREAVEPASRRFSTGVSPVPPSNDE